MNLADLADRIRNDEPTSEDLRHAADIVAAYAQLPDVYQQVGLGTIEATRHLPGHVTAHPDWRNNRVMLRQKSTRGGDLVALDHYNDEWAWLEYGTGRSGSAPTLSDAVRAALQLGPSSA